MGYRVLVLGGYGNFGGRIAARLAVDPAFDVIVAGRGRVRAEAFCRSLPVGAHAQGIGLDITDPAWAAQLDELRPDLVIHAAGPFQRQDYAIAEAVVGRGIHYVDLADGREFVSGFAAQLDEPARSSDVLAVTGASTLPGVSAAVVDALRSRFQCVDSIDCGISPGNRSEPGAATIAAILGYVGRPFPQWRNGAWQPAFGWQQLERHVYPGMGPRWLGACDVPDLELFPARYGSTNVSFKAGLELAPLHLALWGLSWLARIRLVGDFSRYTSTMHRLFSLFRRFSSDIGGMHIRLRGLDSAGAAQALTWSVVARSGDGPQIPCTPAVLLARKLAGGAVSARGARPCLDLFSLDELLAEFAAYDIRARVD